jgi:MFS family permease
MLNAAFNKNLLPLYLSSLISKTGDFAYEVAFAIIAIELLSFDLLHIGTVYFFRFIPYLFFGPIGGWLADATPHKYNMIVSDTLRFVVATALYIMYTSETLNIYSLVIGSMLMTVGRSCFQPSFRAYLPSILSKQELPAGNSLVQIIEDAASILGPLTCALIISFSDKGNVILVYGMTYLLSIFFLLFLEKNTPDPKVGVSLFGFISDASSLARNQNLLIVICGTSVCVLFTASLLRFVLPASIISAHEDEALVGYIFSIMSTGTILGGICYTSLIKSSTPTQLMKAWMAYGLLFLFVSIAVNISLGSTIVFIFLLGFSGAIVDISIITNIQSLSAKNEIGKNYGIYSTVTNTCEAASGFVSGLLALVIGGLSFPIASLLIALAAKLTLVKIKSVKQERL